MFTTENNFDSLNQKSPIKEEIRSLIIYRELIFQFVARSLKIRYKRSILGVIWTMLNPLLIMIVLTIVFSRLFRFQIEFFPIYFLSGQIIWLLFSSATSGSMSEMIWSGDLLKRIYIPKSTFAISSVFTSLINLLLSIVPLIGIALVLGLRIQISLVVWPVAILLVSIFALGIGLLLSTAVIYFADMLPVYEVILTIWLYLTPIIYPLEIVPSEWQWVFRLNPMYYYVEAFRMPLLYGIIPGWGIWLPATVIAIFTLLLGGLVFTAKSNEYAYRV